MRAAGDRIPPLVSVIVPARDAAATVERAVRSALSQTLESIEVIVVDDASRDRTPEIVERLAAADHRVVLLRQAIHGGVSRSRNVGLDHARGRWVAVLDADDWYDPDRLEVLLTTNEDRYDLVADNQTMHEADRSRVRLDMSGDRVLGPADVAGSKLDMRKPGGLGMLKPVVRKTLLDTGSIRYVESARIGGDFVFLMDCIARSPRLLLVSRPMYHYRVASGSLTRSKRLTDLLELCRQYDRLLALPWGADGQDVVRLLRIRRQNAEIYADYHALVEMIRTRRPGGALKALLRNPRAAAWLFRRAVAKGLSSRIFARHR